MRNIKILDCTLRDGGRLINCAFPDEHIRGITEGLCASGVDIIEMGFLRGNVDYNGDSTFFTEIDQFRKFIPENRGNSMFVGFCDYGKEFGMWDFSKLPECDGSSVTGLRIGFRKKDMYNAVPILNLVKEKGYTLFIQGVESLSYSDREMLDLIALVNEVKPYSFGIVDTYGAMYPDDVSHLYNLVDHNMDPDIAIDFHSHNNLQLSFAFAQQIVAASRGVRKVILDASLEGMGKGIGNLNTELIMDFLIRKHAYPYDIDVLFDTIDRYLANIKSEHSWGYQIPYFMAGILSSHANNIIYLTEKHRLDTKDIKNILSLMDPVARKRYNYDDMEKLYIEYSSCKIDDSGALAEIKKICSDRPVLVMVPGSSISREKEKLEAYIEKEKPIVIAVNYVPEKQYDDLYCFFGNKRKYEQLKGMTTARCIVTSNIPASSDDVLVVNYCNLIQTGVKFFDNSAVMLLKLLVSLGVGNIVVAGFDGFDDNGRNFANVQDEDIRFAKDFNQLNKDITWLLRCIKSSLPADSRITFLTGGRFAAIFSEAAKE